MATMLRIHLIVLGKLRELSWQAAEAEYLKRLTPFATVAIHELREESFTEKDPIEVIKEREAKKINEQLEAIEPGLLVALEEKGKQFSSPSFAEQIKKWEEQHGTVTFIIGGPVGLAPTIVKRANATLSLSPMTFTHQMTRVILLEQLYRAAMINGNRRYHY